MLDSHAIEMLSVSAVKDSLVITEQLDPFFNENDKEPSWDGAVYIYSNKKDGKKSNKGRVFVQIKGKKHNIHPNKAIKYPVEIVDLERYLTEGVIYIVVYISEDGCRRKIYYSALTPVAIRFYLQKARARKKKAKRGKGSVSVEFRPFPSDNMKKSEIFINCLHDCEKQRSFAKADLPTIEELEKNGMLESLTASVTSCSSPTDLQSAFLNNDIYLYAKVKGFSVPVPLDGIPEKQVITENVSANISVNGKVYFTGFVRVRSKEDTTVAFGNCLFFKMENGEKSGWRITYTQPDQLRLAVKSIEFIIAVITHGGFNIDEHWIELRVSEKDFTESDLERKEQQLQLCRDTIQALDILNCHEDLQISKITKSDERRINYLISAFVRQEIVSGLKPDLPNVLAMRIGTLRFALYLDPVPGKSGSYKISDFFSIKLTVSVDRDGEMRRISQYSMLTKEDMETLSNFKPEVLLPSYEELDVDEHISSEATYTMLTLLLAYDSTGSKRKELLNTADDFAEWLLSLPANSRQDKDIAQINKLQITLRKRPLTVNEQQELLSIAAGPNTEKSNRLGAYILLGMEELAEQTFSELSTEEQDKFLTYPINRFWRKKDSTK